jgi:hypothetical protein
MVWMMAIGLTAVGWGILVFRSPRWRKPQHPDRGLMSQQWLAEYRAGNP